MYIGVLDLKTILEVFLTSSEELFFQFTASTLLDFL